MASLDLDFTIFLEAGGSVHKCDALYVLNIPLGSPPSDSYAQTYYYDNTYGVCIRLCIHFFIDNNNAHTQKYLTKNDSYINYCTSLTEEYL